MPKATDAEIATQAREVARLRNIYREARAVANAACVTLDAAETVFDALLADDGAGIQRSPAKAGA